MSRPDSTSSWDPGDPEREFEEQRQARAAVEGLTLEELTARRRQTYGGLYDAARGAGDQSGSMAAALVDHDRALIEQSAYPTDACLRPFEVELYLAETLAPARREHVQACAGCLTLVEGAAPSPARREQFFEAVRAAAAAAPLAMTAPKPERDVRPGWLSDMSATGVPLGLIGAGFGIAAGSPLMFSAGLAMAVAAAAALVLANGGRLPSLGAVWIASRGAFVTASIGGLLLLTTVTFVTESRDPGIVGSVTLSSNAEPVSRTVASSQRLEEQATLIAASALRTRQTTGAFPVLREFNPSFSVSTDRLSDARAVYEVVATETSDSLLAQVEQGQGWIYMGAPGAEALQARVVVGRVTRVSPTRVTIQDQDGTTHDLLIASNVPPPTLDDQVVIVTNPEVTRLTSLSVLSSQAAGASESGAAAATAATDAQ